MKVDDQKKEFGKRLAEMRKSKGLSQEQLREMINCPSVQMISGWERGHSFPSAIYLITFAKKLDVSIDYLLLGRKNSNENEPIKTYKDIMSCMLRLIKTDVFSLGGHFFDKSGNWHDTVLTSNDSKIAAFREEFSSLLAASKTLGPDLFETAVTNLLARNEIPLEKKKQ
ncbi:MAG: helix-turn-helix transcriptional regulator [Bacilli bacterium]|nr:helix-turn-helix transcriptional regulator [Bacilli bacterium]